MDIGRATNCDLEPSGEGGGPRFTQRTSAAVRCAAALAAVELQGAGVVVRRTDNPTRPTAAELQAVYEPGDNALTVSDIVLDAVVAGHVQRCFFGSSIAASPRCLPHHAQRRPMSTSNRSCMPPMLSRRVSRSM